MKGLINKLASWGTILMNHGKYEQKISRVIQENLIDDLKKRKSCRCNLFIFYDKEKRSNLLNQIMSKQDIKITEWEALTVINETADKIQRDDPNEYPIKDPTDAQIEKFAINISNHAACYFSSEHSNTITLPIHNMPSAAQTYLINKELPNVKFIISDSKLQINLANQPMWATLFSSIMKHYILFIITSGIAIIVCIAIYKRFLRFTQNDNKTFSQSKAANLTAVSIFFCTIIFYTIYGQLFPFNRAVLIRPYEDLLEFVAILSAITFSYFIFLGTTFVGKKISSAWVAMIIRITLTLLYSSLGYGLFFILLLSSCTFGAGECCC